MSLNLILIADIIRDLDFEKQGIEEDMSSINYEADSCYPNLTNKAVHEEKIENNEVYKGNSSDNEANESTPGDETDLHSRETEDEIDPHCAECKIEYKDPPADTLIMFLHALRYSGEGWSYQTEMPAWTKLQ